MVALTQLQKHLERIYELSVGVQVERFLITDPAVVRELDSSEHARETPEKLLVHQDGEYVDVALYLDSQLLERWRADDPIQCLHDGNVGTLWTVLEGVSHFVYLCWNAHRNRPVTLFELELQAEVDKFVVTSFLLGKQFGGHIPARLHSSLFAEPAFDNALNTQALWRYRNASHYAGRYCAQIQKRFLRAGQDASMFNELRRFYRLPHCGKLDRIRSMHRTAL